MRVTDLESIRIKVASPDEILKWSHGEVTKAETINYRTQRAEKDGLFCERIFGPEKDYECYCGKYRKIRYKGVVCEKCGVEVTKSSVRRERMGHIKLAAPCSHIWFLRGVPSRVGQALDIPFQNLERVIYFAAHVITKVDEQEKKKVLEEIETEFRKKSKGKDEKEKLEVKQARDKAREEVTQLKPFRTLSELDYQNLSLKYGQMFEAGTGGEIVRKLLEGIDCKKQIGLLEKEIVQASPINRKKIASRLKLFRGMLEASIRPEWMILTQLPVLPPDLRPMVQLDGGRYASSDLNDLYRRVINRNNRLKYLLEIAAPDVIVRNEKRMLQEAVDALIDNSMRKGTMTQATTGGRRLLKSLADMLKGKQGRFRQNLLGKRVDYSGRSVIVVGPDLKLNQCGLPKHMALELFKPFIINKILERELAYNVRGASRLIEQEIDEVWAILEEVVRDKLVMLNRAPTLHRLGIQAFYPLLIEGEAIQLHPLVCLAFNADFDGDQMAVHVPLGVEAQKEAKELMFSSLNILKPATGTPVVVPRQDMILGCYYLTFRLGIEAKKSFGSSEEALLAYETGVVLLQEPIKIYIKKNLEETTAGRIIFNESFPEDYPFFNDQVTAKKMESMVGDLVEKYSQTQVQEILDSIKHLGFEYATKSGVSWGIDDLTVPKEKRLLLQGAEKEIEAVDTHWKHGLLSREERSSRVIEIWQGVKLAIEKLVPQALPVKGSVFSIIDSGARGSWSQPVQMAGMKGLVINPAGRIIELPVKSSFKEGFDVLEYFISTHGARKGTADTALRTSTAGYLTRRLVDVAHDIIVTEEDCKDKEGIKVLKQEAVDLGQNLAFKIVGRVSVDDVKGHVKKKEIINWHMASAIAKDEKVEKLRCRSPLSCKTFRGVCRMCYGWDLGSNALVAMGSAVGIVAAQSIGEPGTQLTMRTFHTGGVAGGGDITQGLPRVEEIFEGRVPGGKAIMAESDGVVEDISPEGIMKIIKGKDVTEYAIPANYALWVQKGDAVVKGQQLCEGNLDLQELFLAAGKKETQRYIVREIQRIYASQGASIHDKHIEVICRQMFSRMKIKERGASRFTDGEVVDTASFLEENAKLKNAGKDLSQASVMLLGISKIAVTTESFLSAASFQETSRVLIRAALEGKEDKLRGLKENVILGKLIPAGTAFQGGK
ncbi:MAG: DNA-directed RNA polymerase subunit beta' [Parcubacteria group bacterium GW2011_GWA1_53_13]|nr:MAG: DNA-directed RNA polymerase subunit beta' [Parcubacteria group bacterium GW2011_GWA1_53_13]